MRAPVRPDLQEINESWLGAPTDVDSVDALAAIDLIRRSLGGRPQLPKQHLGEAQIIYHIEASGRGVMATDDRDAAILATNRSLTVVDTFDIVAECFEVRLIGCPDAFDLLKRMAGFDRGVYVPPTHWYVCP